MLMKLRGYSCTVHVLVFLSANKAEYARQLFYLLNHHDVNSSMTITKDVQVTYDMHQQRDDHPYIQLAVYLVLTVGHNNCPNSFLGNIYQHCFQKTVLMVLTVMTCSLPSWPVTVGHYNCPDSFLGNIYQFLVHRQFWWFWPSCRVPYLVGPWLLAIITVLIRSLPSWPMTVGHYNGPDSFLT